MTGPLPELEHEPILSDAERDVEEDSQDSFEDDVHVASEAEKRIFWWRNAVINSFFILAWFLFATVLSVYNKWMFSPNHFNFPYPLFVTTLHLSIQFLLSASLRFAFPRRFASDKRPTLRNYSIKVLPASVATGLDIGLSNVSLKSITLSFYTMCKSSSLIFVLFFAFLFRLEAFSIRLVIVILIIFSGVLLMVASETAFVWSGFLLVIFASVCGGLRWSVTQVAMLDKTMGLDNPPSTLFWLSPASAISLALVSIAWEGWINVFSSPFFATMASTMNTLLKFIVPGIAAFCMVMSEFYIIQRAGVLPMSIAGIAKEVSTITISAWFFGDELTPVNITGVAITICGIALFTYHKYRKTVNSKVTLDIHGNVIQLESADSSGQESMCTYDVELVGSSYNTPSHPSVSAPIRNLCGVQVTEASANKVREDANGDMHHHLLFSSEDLDGGDEDAEEIRSFRSSKLNWGDTADKT